jgi:hypothetical protein
MDTTAAVRQAMWALVGCLLLIAGLLVALIGAVQDSGGLVRFGAFAGVAGLAAGGWLATASGR